MNKLTVYDDDAQVIGSCLLEDSDYDRSAGANPNRYRNAAILYLIRQRHAAHHVYVDEAIIVEHIDIDGVFVEEHCSTRSGHWCIESEDRTDLTEISGEWCVVTAAES